VILTHSKTGSGNVQYSRDLMSCTTPACFSKIYTMSLQYVLYHFNVALDSCEQVDCKNC